MTEFEQDLYPEQPKILFIGIPYSTHTISWIDLLKDQPFNVRLFSSTDGYPSNDWAVKTYITCRDLPEGMDPAYRQTLYPRPESWREAESQYIQESKKYFEILNKWASNDQVHFEDDRLFWAGKFFLNKINGFYSRIKSPLRVDLRNFTAGMLDSKGIQQPHLPNLNQFVKSAQQWLADIIQTWKPDIIHTLGLYNYHGGQFYYQTRKRYHLEHIGKWVVQARGGPDMVLCQEDEQVEGRLTEILREADQIICDNRINVRYASGLGASDSKFSKLIPVPGTGGIDVLGVAGNSFLFPSKRERVILIPKAYNSIQSTQYPVLEALQLCWENIQPSRVVFLAASQELRIWLNTLPANIRSHIEILESISRDKVFQWMRSARIMLSISLWDGVPNVLYEAMACGAFPIISPLDTLTDLFKPETNCLYARNLYPQEIANALTRAMQDDNLVDSVVKNNQDLVRLLADRDVIRSKVVSFYQNLVKDSVE